jgi:hypothetical protein
MAKRPPPPRSLYDAVVAAAAGVPAKIVALMRAAHLRVGFEAPTPPPELFLRGAEAVAPLREHVRDLFLALALLDCPFDLDDVDVFASLRRAEAIDALEELIWRGVLRANYSKFLFVSEDTRLKAVAANPPERRRDLHARHLGFFIFSHRFASAFTPLPAAAHFAALDLRADAFSFFSAAAMLALGLRDLTRAAFAFDAALALLRTHPPLLPPPAHATWICRAARVYEWGGQEAGQLGREALALLQVPPPSKLRDFWRAFVGDTRLRPVGCWGACFGGRDDFSHFGQQRAAAIVAVYNALLYLTEELSIGVGSRFLLELTALRAYALLRRHEELLKFTTRGAAALHVVSTALVRHNREDEVAALENFAALSPPPTSPVFASASVVDVVERFFRRGRTDRALMAAVDLIDSDPRATQFATLAQLAVLCAASFAVARASHWDLRVAKLAKTGLRFVAREFRWREWAQLTAQLAFASVRVGRVDEAKHLVASLRAFCSRLQFVGAEDSDVAALAALAAAALALRDAPREAFNALARVTSLRGGGWPLISWAHFEAAELLDVLSDGGGGGLDAPTVGELAAVREELEEALLSAARVFRVFKVSLWGGGGFRAGPPRGGAREEFAPQRPQRGGGGDVSDGYSTGGLDGFGAIVAEFAG